MRTTLNIDEDALALIKKYAEERSLSLGQATSDLVHRGAENLPKFKTRNGWALIDSPPITSAQVRQWEEEDAEQEYTRAISPRR